MEKIWIFGRPFEPFYFGGGGSPPPVVIPPPPPPPPPMPDVGSTADLEAKRQLLAQQAASGRQSTQLTGSQGSLKTAQNYAGGNPPLYTGSTLGSTPVVNP